MKYIKNYQCTICHEVFPQDANPMTCPHCGEKGILEINYDYEAMKKEVNVKYFNNNQNYTMLRYQPLMSIKEYRGPTLKVGWTPLYKSENLRSLLGINTLYIKDEGLNPTASLKDRASLVACLKAIEDGNDVICCSSTGNAASSLAGNAAKMGLKTMIFVPKRAPLGKIAQLVMYGSNVVKIDGDYKETFDVSKAVIDKYQFYNRNAAINPHLVEGKKTVALEIAEQVNFSELDYVFVSVGDGCTIYGVYKGFYDLMNLGLISNIPKIVGVQSSGCCPFVDAFESNTPLKEAKENTIADSIAVGIPRNPKKGMKAVQDSSGFYMKVTDEEIIEAMNLLGKTEGIFAEPAGATGLAGLVKAVNNSLISKDSKIAIIITGNGLKDQNSILHRVEETYQIKKAKMIQKIESKSNQNTSIDGLLQLLENEEVK